MGTMASQITGVLIVCSAVCSGADKKPSKFRVTGLCEGNSPVNYQHKELVTWKFCYLMTLSWPETVSLGSSSIYESNTRMFACIGVTVFVRYVLRDAYMRRQLKMNWYDWYDMEILNPIFWLWISRNNTGWCFQPKWTLMIKKYSRAFTRVGVYWSFDDSH